jgi:hypothetical protein
VERRKKGNLNEPEKQSGREDNTVNKMINLKKKKTYGSWGQNKKNIGNQVAMLRGREGYVSRKTKPQQKGKTKKSVYRFPHVLSGQGNKSFETERNRKRSRMEEGLNTSTVALRVVGGDKKGSLESETVKYGPEALARTSSNCKRQTHPLVREDFI